MSHWINSIEVFECDMCGRRLSRKLDENHELPPGWNVTIYWNWDNTKIVRTYRCQACLDGHCYAGTCFEAKRLPDFATTVTKSSA